MSENLDIKTFAFLDLETTGLPYEEYNKTKITELCCIGVKARDINSNTSPPRIMQKINLCFYPEKMINYESEKLTGLSNDLLEFEPRFKKPAAEVINGLLNLLEKPVCFVAHNGNSFDYPILKAEMEKAGDNLDVEFLCVDSLIMFKEFYEEDASTEAMLIDNSCQQEELDGFENLGILAVKKDHAYVQEINETTPPKKFKSILINDDLKTTNVDDLYYVPGDNKKINRDSPAARKQLKFGLPSFKLPDVYERLTKKCPLVSHRAEEDVLMLIACAASMGRRFTDWANQNARKLSEIPVMKPGRKIGT